MTEIVFLRPKMDLSKVPPPYSPLGIGYMAAVLREHGHQVHFIDCAILDEPYSQSIRRVKSLNPDAIGITGSYTSQYSEMKKLSGMLHKLDIPIILGGVHVTFLPELCLKECKADFAVIGEGELTILELMDLWENKEKRKQIKGIAYIENNQFRINSKREFIENLDDLPFPAWDLINPLVFPSHAQRRIMKRYPVAPLITTRGCPFKCSYCASTNFWHQKFRRRSPQR